MTTERLYYSDSYLATFPARVTARADDGRRIYLDRSAFYPTSGGQLHDTGTLTGIAITNVVDEDDRVAHLLASPLPADLVDVTGKIDWVRRFDHMQQHTGQHLLTAVFADLFRYATDSVHFGIESSSIDLDADMVSRDRIVAAERRANEVVAANRPVHVTFEDAQSATGLRKASDRSGTLRIVTIDALDRSACGGTHVQATGEIGTILLRRTEKIRTGTRIEFLCGSRAVRRARADFDALSAIAQSLTASIDDAAPLVETQTQTLRDAESWRKRAEGELATHRAKGLWDTTAPDPGGVRTARQRQRSGSLEELRALALAFSALPKTVFIGVSESPPSVMLVASADAGLDAGRTLKEALATVNGRGGGSPRIAQGSVPDVAALERVLTLLGGTAS